MTFSPVVCRASETGSGMPHMPVARASLAVSVVAVISALQRTIEGTASRGEVDLI